ncbi:MAG: hypothetical protein KAU38_10475, partial [Desulfobacterales bacterium]|nr:hypothetical protein [Desulfobacterales bacterium]
IMNLEKIDPTEMMVFLKKQFSKGHIKVTEHILHSVLEISENVPYNVQFFCYFSINPGNRSLPH